MQTAKTKNLAAIVLVALMGWFSWLMLGITLQYIPVQRDVAFLQIKQSYINNTVWFWSFYIHVYTSMIALLAGFIQFWPQLLRRYKQLHRTMGYAYIIVVVGISGPASLIMGWYANGGLSSRIAFVLLALLWIFTTAKALQAALRKNYVRHKQFMIRSYALTLSAITLRAWKWIIVYCFEPKPMDVYQIVAWVGWVGNLLIAEYIIYRQHLARVSKN